MNQSNGLVAGVYRFKVPTDAAGQRLDIFLAGAGEAWSRGAARSLIDLGGVHLCGRRVKRCSQTLAAGDRIEVYVDGQPLAPMQLTEEQVLYRDRDLIALDKPAGMATQPTPARYQGTVYAALQKLLDGGKAAKPSIGMVQRLDRDTSGVMVFSIHARAHKALTAAFTERRVGKLYWALVAGRPETDEGVFHSQLARRRSTNRMVSVERGGKPAETRYRVLGTAGAFSLVEVELVTGRSHQIRVHFSEAGHPLLGDVSYGGPGQVDGIIIQRQMLHARQLALQHPVSGAPLRFRSPLPPDFRALLAAHDGLSALLKTPEKE